jgi:predicted  nucleic acid-binding Zn-ribbon protein
MRFQRGFLAGVQLYVLVAALVTFAGLGLAVAYYKNSAARAQAEATLARDQRDRAIDAIKASEEANKRLKDLNKALNAAVVERDRRARDLAEARRAAMVEINELKHSLDEADRKCLDRDLPSALLERLRQGEVPAAP